MGPQTLKKAIAHQVDIPTRYSSRQITAEHETKALSRKVSADPFHTSISYYPTRNKVKTGLIAKTCGLG
jgi:hypothetical protein